MLRNFVLPDTLRSLKYKNYQFFFAAQALSLTALWMHRVAMGWLVFRLTGSDMALGVVDFVTSLPILLFSAFAGSIIEHCDLRKTLAITQSCCVCVALILAFCTLTGWVNFKIVLIMSFTLGLIDSFELPCRYAIVNFLVDKKEDVSNAVALNSMNFNMARMAGPTLAGFIIHATGEGFCFILNAFAYSSTLLAIKQMKMTKPAIGKKESTKVSIIKETIEGIKAANSFAPSKYILLLITFTGFFAFPVIVLMPSMAKGVFAGTPQTLGFLLMGVAIGALVGSIVMATLKSSKYHSWWATRTCVAFGIAVSLFAISPNSYIGVILAAPVGFCMVVSTIACNTLLQNMAPDDSKSRIMSLYTIAIVGIPPFGSLLAGKMGDMMGTRASLFICGLLASMCAYVIEHKLDIFHLKKEIITALNEQHVV
ncbi:MAG: MFS transporter [Synergistaceae bacterium]